MTRRIGESRSAQEFAVTASRYYALLHARRFLDFSTSQAEFLRLLDSSPEVLADVRGRLSHLVVDEVQDVNAVQSELTRIIHEETAPRVIRGAVSSA